MSEEDEWVILGDGTKLHVPRLPPQEAPEELAGNTKSKDDKGFHLLEKARSAWGSTAGAGSDFFHVYRKQRAREMARQEQLDKDWEEKSKNEKFQNMRMTRIQEHLDKQVKKSEKRKRKQLNAAIKKANAQAAARHSGQKSATSVLEQGFDGTVPVSQPHGIKETNEDDD